MQNGASRLVKLQARLRTTTNDSAIAAALDGFGLTRILSYQVAEHLRTGRLVTVLAAFEPAAWPVHVLHREGQNATQRVRAFLDLVIERLRGAEGLQ
jgi:DNA-binding transcriptional LysR family regulator